MLLERRCALFDGGVWWLFVILLFPLFLCFFVSDLVRIPPPEYPTKRDCVSIGLALPRNAQYRRTHHHAALRKQNAH